MFLIVFGVSDMEMGFGGASLHPIVLVMGGAVTVLSAYLFGRRRKLGAGDGMSRALSPIGTAVAAFAAGPLVALAVVLAVMTAGDVAPADRGSVIVAVLGIGFFVGTVVAALTLVGWRLK
jgi:hypothetical protein